MDASVVAEMLGLMCRWVYVGVRGGVGVSLCEWKCGCRCGCKCRHWCGSSVGVSVCAGVWFALWMSYKGYLNPSLILNERTPESSQNHHNAESMSGLHGFRHIKAFGYHGIQP